LRTRPACAPEEVLLQCFFVLEAAYANPAQDLAQARVACHSKQVLTPSTRLLGSSKNPHHLRRAKTKHHCRDKFKSRAVAQPIHRHIASQAQREGSLRLEHKEEWFRDQWRARAPVRLLLFHSSRSRTNHLAAG